MSEPLRVVCYVARSHGLAGLRALMASDRYEVAAVVTHKREPWSGASDRVDYPDFVDVAESCGCAPFAVDNSTEQAVMVDSLDELAFDLIVSINWRRLLTPRQLAQPRLGGVNLHRGALPMYAGARPLRRAVEAGDHTFWNVAHEMTPEIDAGPMLAEDKVYDPRRPDDTDDTHWQRVLDTMGTRTEELLLAALDEMVRRHG